MNIYYSVDKNRFALRTLLPKQTFLYYYNKQGIYVTELFLFFMQILKTNYNLMLLLFSLFYIQISCTQMFLEI